MTSALTTLGEHLSTPVAVSVAEYEASQCLNPRQGASWAVWGERTGDLSVFDDASLIAPRLRKDVVLIGANFGLDKGDAGGFRPFQNFHSAKSGGDTKLRNGVTGTVLEGAFLTDLVKDYPTKYANGLAKAIRNGSLDTRRHVRSGFEAEQKALGLDVDTLYIPVGATTRTLWDLLVTRGVIPAEQRVFHRHFGAGPLFAGKPVTNLRHYSGSVNMVAAVQALLAQVAQPFER